MRGDRPVRAPLGLEPSVASERRCALGKKILISIAALAAALAVTSSPVAELVDAAQPQVVLADLPGGGGTGP